MEFIETLTQFINNGGRLHKNAEPKYGEPFYDSYMKQYILIHYKPGDKIRIKTDTRAYEGKILTIDYCLEILTAGRKVYKNKKNKATIRYEKIIDIELISRDDSFDLKAADPIEWEIQNNKEDNKRENEKTENRRRTRDKDIQAFNHTHPNVEFEKSHIIRVCNGPSLYWPFENNGISAEVFMVRNNNIITKIPCEVGTPFPNTNHYHAYNYIKSGDYPELYTHLPDFGFIYENINIICVWTIKTISTNKELTIKTISIHHIDEIKPIKNEHNIIFIDMHAAPLIGHGNSLFKDSKKTCFLEDLMNRDAYFIINPQKNNAIVVKAPEEMTDVEIDDTIFTATMASRSFEITNTINFLSEKSSLEQPIEVFFNSEKNPERYYSRAWRYCKKEYEFKLLNTTATDTPHN